MVVKAVGEGEVAGAGVDGMIDLEDQVVKLVAEEQAAEEQEVEEQVAEGKEVAETGEEGKEVAEQVVVETGEEVKGEAGRGAEEMEDGVTMAIDDVVVEDDDANGRDHHRERQ